MAEFSRFLQNLIGETVKMMDYMDCAERDLPTLRADKSATALRQQVRVNVLSRQQIGVNVPGEQQVRVNVLEQRERKELRHILLGSPEAIRQAIHQLHVLNYAESLLWSPISSVGDRIILTPAQGEAMSLLRR